MFTLLLALVNVQGECVLIIYLHIQFIIKLKKKKNPYTINIHFTHAHTHISTNSCMRIDTIIHFIFKYTGPTELRFKVFVKLTPRRVKVMKIHRIP